MSSLFPLPLVLALFSCAVWLASALSVVLVVWALGAATVNLIHRAAPRVPSAHGLAGQANRAGTAARSEAITTQPSATSSIGAMWRR